MRAHPVKNDDCKIINSESWLVMWCHMFQICWIYHVLSLFLIPLMPVRTHFNSFGNVSKRDICLQLLQFVISGYCKCIYFCIEMFWIWTGLMMIKHQANFVFSFIDMCIIICIYIYIQLYTHNWNKWLMFFFDWLQPQTRIWSPVSHKNLNQLKSMSQNAP